MSSPGRLFDRIGATFLGNVDSVRTLADEIARLADQHDKDRDSRAFAGVMEFLGAPAEMIQEMLDQFEPREERNDSVTEEEGTGDFPAHQLVEFVAAKHPQRLAALEEVVHATMRGGARQGQLLRRGALTLLASFFETLLSELVRAYYLTFPNALPADGVSLSLGELRRIGSISDAERYIATKESEKLLRESFETQMKFFAGRFKFDPANIPGYTAMKEVVQRRNLIVHNDAIVNRIYLESTPKEFIEKYEVRDGARLLNSPPYLEHATNTVLAIGFFLLQHSWRAWGKDARGADGFAVQLVYRLGKEGRHDIATTLAEIASEFSFASEEHRRMLAINHAVALRDSGNADGALKVIDGLDWSAASLRFRAVVAAVRGDVDEFEKLATKAISAGELQRYELATWTAFSSFRDHPSYRALLCDEPPSA